MTDPRIDSPTSAPPRRRSTFRRVLIWTGSILGVLLIGVLIAGDIVLHHAGPILKSKVVDTLSTRFDSRVELAGFQVSVVKGFEVSGTGLKLYPNHIAMKDPLIQVDRFYFHALSWRQLFQTPLFINRVQVRGLEIHLPPKNQRANMPHLEDNSKPGADQSHNGIKILVGEILVDQARLVFENSDPSKVPLTFVIHQIALHTVGPGRAMKFHATLVNPKPLGNIDSTGDFGPFDADSPGDTPVDGRYSFTKADLSTIKGIGGMLASTGNYQGKLNHIVVDGETTTPDFRLSTADHPMPLKTTFHAIVDGTNGDTHLEPVDAWLEQTHIVASGDVAHVPGQKGRDIRLDFTEGPGRIQDLLQLAVKSQQPLMTGQVVIHAAFNIPPGDQSVVDKLQLKGTFSLDGIHFTSDKIQNKVDELSLRGQGKPQLAEQEDDAMKSDNIQQAIAADVASQMRGNFTLANGKIDISTLNYRVPGADVALSGSYTLDGEALDFTGTARLNAHVSQMVTGWKSWLLRPVDPFFAKNGAGTEVPVRITGTRSSPQIGLNFH